MTTLFVIPARLASTRLPGKMLMILDEDNQKTVLQMTYESVLRSRHATKTNVVIATCDEEIRHHAMGFGAQVCMTSKTCRSGSDRVQEAVRTLEGNQTTIVNVQGDEPFMDADHIDSTLNGLVSNSWADVSTCAVVKEGPATADPSKVKVVCATNGRALYFSRHAIPYGGQTWRNHIGIYAFRPSILQLFTQLPPSSLEQCESLEQLRLLEHGYQVHVSDVTRETFGGIDTPSDFARAKAHLHRLTKPILRDKVQY